MDINEFDYYLPQELIAQTPLEKRDSSRLLVLDKNTGEICHKQFFNIIDYLHEGDVLVLNNTKVLPARLHGVKEDTKAVIELLLLKEMGNDTWECLAKPARRIKEGTVVEFSKELKAKCVKVLDDGIRHMQMIYDGIFLEILEKLGEMPLPPYIHEKLEDKDRYQTVYAKEPGSAAAPTAGLHFTKELLKKIEEKGVLIQYVTLNVGLGTFRPVEENTIEDHKMHSEFYQISQEVADNLNKAMAEKRRIVCVGTTSLRTLEAAYDNGFKEKSGWTDIFIYPGYKFKAVNALITNFHLPKSTLVMLVSALAGRDNILNAYKIAIENKYRFFSFGDAMFIH